ncbi:MAG: sensor histidine kinase [Salinivirgaceae bacterium]|nr:sensor histidine kinase [Salinivirgaceae bacterium]
MTIKIALILSVILQFGASFIALSLIRRTKYNISWVLITISFLLMAIRRLIELIEIFSADKVSESPLSSWIAIIISTFIFIGTIYIRRIFDFQRRIDELRKENELRVLSAIIRTEEKERREFAKEIHDGLGPILSAIKMSSSAISESILTDANKKIVTNVDKAIDEAITSVKEISNKLSPHLLERFGLDKAIKSFKDNIVGASLINITYSSNLNNNRYDYNTEVILYRVVCELLSNTLKYASAKTVNISLFDNSNALDLIYVDDGIGFNIPNIQTKGMGLFNVRSRINSLNGTIEMHSEPNEGFLLKASVKI